MENMELPSDLFTFNEEPAVVWQMLQAQDADARAKRTDVVGSIALEERAAGKLGWRERVQNRLTAEGHEPVSPKVISDGAKIFALFRLGGERGLGWTRERLAQHQPGRLRVFAQNAEWSLRNRERVEDMLASGVNEYVLRQTVREAKEAEANGDEPVVREEWATISVRLDPAQARFVRAALEAVQVKRRQEGDEFSAKESVALGQALLAMASEWTYQSTTYDDGNGGDLVIENVSFFEPTIRGELENASAQAAD